MAVGKIQGQMLGKRVSATRDTLDRNGVDIAFETDLVYFDVNNLRIGIKKANPSYELDVNGTTLQENLYVDTQFTNSDITITNAEIETALGSLNITATDRIEAPSVSTNSININDNVISSLTNSNIEIRPDATGPTNGTVEIFSNTYVDGSVYASGNITFDGNITFGDANTDAIELNADITSDIVPDVDNTVSLGDTSSKRFSNLYTKLANGLQLLSTSLTTSEGINLALRPENSWFVAANGDDANEGDHPNGPFATIAHATSVAQPGDTIFVYPGTYEETFPITVPERVTITGENIRSVTVKPTLATQSNNAFLLNGETTVENLTVKDFYYDSINDTGYAFSFAPGYISTSRSPYIRNVTVLTTGSTTTAADPRGYAASDAGKGALVDGSVVDASSETASMLFHSVTFITPGVDALTMTNGVRVEWLNSFTYFAYRGLYLLNGVAGKASDATTFGAEMRSIGSANVYGYYGAVADGADTLAYLIGHNFAYVGTEGNEENDVSLVNQPNEFAELNGGRIYTNTVDQEGDFRIGNIFVVDQQTGIISFNAQSINISPTGNIVLENAGNRTYIDAHEMSVDNIQISGNTISSLSGPVNFHANSGTTTWNTNVNVAGNVDVTGNTVISGNVTVGNDPLDTVQIEPDLTQTIEPETDRTYNLGNKTDPKVWDIAFIKELEVDEVIDVLNNEITTIATNTDLRFEANGTGIIHVTSTDVQIDNNLTINTNLTVNGDTSLRNTDITGTITQTGDILQTGNLDITGNFETLHLDISGVGSYLDIPDVRIQNNLISATALNDDLIFTGNGTGGIKLDSFLTITDTTIENTRIGAATDAEKSIYLTPNGTGNLDINTNTTLKLPLGSDADRVLDTNGQLRFNTSSTLIEGYAPSGNVNLIDIFSSDRTSYITPESTRGAGDNVIRFATNSQVHATIDENKLYTATLHMGNVKVTGNTFSNLVDGNDLSFSVSGTGVVNLVSANITMQDTTILNLSNSALTFTNTDNGYLKVDGSNGLVLPNGSDPDIGGSMYMDQSVNQHIGMVQGWELNNSSYSAECWFKITAGTSGTLIGASQTNGFTMRINNLSGPNNIEVLGLDGTSNTFSCGAITLNSWNHIAACRDSLGNETVFLNGVRASSQTGNTITYNGATQYIGKNQNGDYFTGYITSVRVQQDETKYDPLASTINVPIVPPKHNSFTRVCFRVLNAAYLIIDDSQQQEVTNYGTITYSADTPYTNTQPANPELGTTRLNFNTETVEVYNGTVWLPIYGSSESVTLGEVEDIADIWGLILG